MRLLPSFVFVEEIICDQPASLFDSKEIEAAARAIIAAEGTINPIIVERIGIDSYQLIDGYFQYHAAIRAQEFDLEKGETISAYIIDQDNQEIIKQQLEIFRKPPTQSIFSEVIISNNNSTQFDFNSDSRLTNLESRLNNIESRFEARLTQAKNEYSQTLQQQQKQIQELKNKLPEKLEPLATFNQASVNDLIIKLKPITKNKTEGFVNQIVQARSTKPFSSLQEVIDQVQGIAEKTMFKILDTWLYKA
jgi:ParB family chromosome partitioning protein